MGQLGKIYIKVAASNTNKPAGDPQVPRAGIPPLTNFVGVLDPMLANVDVPVLFPVAVPVDFEPFAVPVLEAEAEAFPELEAEVEFEVPFALVKKPLLITS